jgi:uncharacterized protein (DUF1697 family)
VTVSVALLRGINVGGHRKVPMATLRTAFEDAGYEDVTTYIQSGNVVFSHRERPAAELRADIEAVIADAMGFEVPVMVRTRAELADVVAGNPYSGIEATTLHVLFLADDVTAGALADLDALDVDRFAPETLVRSGCEIYLHLPDGMGRAKLPVALGRLDMATTARNWRTIEKLLELASA